MVRRERRTYNPVASTEEESNNNGNEDVSPPRQQPAPLPLAAVVVGGGGDGPRYQRVATTSTTTTVATSAEDDERRQNAVPARRVVPSSQDPLSKNGNQNDEETGTLNSEEEDDSDFITVTLLDFAQTKFSVRVSPSWTVQQLKSAGVAAHKVQPDRQRLVFRGKMLQDDTRLQDVGITEDHVIIHLFPKPRVVISNQNSTSDSDSACNPADPDGDAGDSTAAGARGARVPTIVLDAEEAERRSHILVLGSVEYIEAQNNVKLFSFMLLIISSIELLNLLAIALGVPQDDGTGSMNGGMGGSASDQDSSEFLPYQTDDDELFGPTSFEDSHHLSNDTYTMSQSPYDTDPALALYEQWGPANYVDLAISTLGVYVAFLGLKASNENTLKLARQYLVGTFCVGVAWLAFNYYMSVEIDEAVEEEREEARNNNEPGGPYNDDQYPLLSDNDIYKGALQVMVLPGMVWLLCCFRAWQFQRLLHEAEEEAVGRIQSQLQEVMASTQQAQSQPVSSTSMTSNHRSTSENSNNNNEEDLERQEVRNAIFT